MNSLRSNLQEITRRLEQTFVGRCIGACIELQGIDRAMVIASQALTALIPLLILVSTLAPADRRDIVSQGFINRFHLTGSAAEAVTEVFARPAGGASVGAAASTAWSPRSTCRGSWRRTANGTDSSESRWRSSAGC